MPVIGEVRLIGERPKRKYLWAACADCGKERWVRYDKPSKRCRFCASIVQQGSGGNNWKGGRKIDRDGYILLNLLASNPFCSMADSKRYVYEHRLVMAKHLGRCLLASEVVHHKNRIRNDNRIENLELTTPGKHSVHHHPNQKYQLGYQKGFKDGQLLQSRELKQEIRLLRLEIRRLTELEVEQHSGIEHDRQGL